MLRETQICDANMANPHGLLAQLAQAEERSRYGEITITDVRQTETRLSGACAATSKAQAYLELSRAHDREIVGDMPSSLETWVPRIAPPDSETTAQAFERVLPLAIRIPTMKRKHQRATSQLKKPRYRRKK